MSDAFKDRLKKKNADELRDEAKRIETLIDRGADAELITRNIAKFAARIESTSLTPEHRYELNRRATHMTKRREAKAEEQAANKQVEDAEREYMRLMGMLSRVEKLIAKPGQWESKRLELTKVRDGLAGKALKKKDAETLQTRIREVADKLRERQTADRERLRAEKSELDRMKILGAIARAERQARVSIQWDAIEAELQKAQNSFRGAKLSPAIIETLTERLTMAANVYKQRRHIAEKRKHEREAEMAGRKLASAVKRFEWFADKARSFEHGRREYEKLQQAFQGVRIKKDDAQALKDRLRDALARLNQRAQAEKQETIQLSDQIFAEIGQMFDEWERMARQSTDIPAIKQGIAKIHEVALQNRNRLTLEQNQRIIDRIARGTKLLSERRRETRRMTRQPGGPSAATGQPAPQSPSAANAPASSAPATPTPAQPAPAADGSENESYVWFNDGLDRLEEMIDLATEFHGVRTELETLQWGIQDATDIPGDLITALKNRADKMEAKIDAREKALKQKHETDCQQRFEAVKPKLIDGLKQAVNHKDHDEAYAHVERMRDKILETEPLLPKHREALENLVDQAAAKIQERIDAHFAELAAKEDAEREKREAPIREEIMGLMEKVSRIEAEINNDEGEIAIRQSRLNMWRPGSRQADHRSDWQAEIEVLRNGIDAKLTEVDRLQRKILELDRQLETPVTDLMLEI